MTKDQALYTFWHSFGLPVYDETTVPTGDNAPAFPYITYNTETDSMDSVLNLHGSLWYHSPSWDAISAKKDQISAYIGDGRLYQIESGDLYKGYMWIVKGIPFAQRLEDDTDDMVRRIYINIQIEFLSK